MLIGKIVEYENENGIETWRNEWGNWYIKGPNDRAPKEIMMPDDPSDFCMHYGDPDNYDY